MNSEKIPSLTAARIAVLVMFLANGVTVGSWFARIPSFKTTFALSDSSLGFILLFVSVGTIGALLVTSGFVARYGSRAITTVGAILCAIALPVIALMPTPYFLAVALLFLGIAITVQDVSMNTQGAEVERQRGLPMMSSFHAAWSIGLFAGTGLGALMISIKVTPEIHYAAVAGSLLAISLVASRFLLPPQDEPGGADRKKESVFQLPARALWPIGLVALCCGLGEGSASDWSGVYLKETIGAAPDIVPVGVVVYSAFMTLSRLAGDWLTARFTAVNVVRVGNALAAAGLLAVVLFPNVTVALIGFGAVGLGIANGIPLAFSAGGNVPGVPPSKGIAGVATIGYGAFLAGPPIIGVIAEATSLRFALGLVAIAIAAAVFLANAMKQKPTEEKS